MVINCELLVLKTTHNLKILNAVGFFDGISSAVGSSSSVLSINSAHNSLLVCSVN